MLPNADKAAGSSTNEILARTGNASTDRQAVPTPSTLEVAEFLHNMATGYFIGSEDTFQLGMPEAI